MARCMLFLSCFLHNLHNSCDRGAQSGVDGEFYEEVHADKRDEKEIDNVRAARIVLQNGLEDVSIQ